ncbi:hypothetical protein GLAREA_06720 [Glarea lozoyensis ATCC 20868]|uniref:Uncharacterized protein n=1 Tax=Glarea lozoyensis (strain ATCC 20868 / MF5171) TaxID=1116229 RepID=S3D5G4_GLAL2|nr:uncharacterized protein GLAREA_06720 [Glarea lozoyensis ATCC 20868]EPE33707.1 hypothetical protein GLAREA_06720 [Glarea lozoyensis ATCC 20868]
MSDPATPPPTQPTIRHPPLRSEIDDLMTTAIKLMNDCKTRGRERRPTTEAFIKEHLIKKNSKSTFIKETLDNDMKKVIFWEKALEELITGYETFKSLVEKYDSKHMNLP